MRPAAALAFGAHPDDVEFQAGGTLAGWAAAGVRVEIACFTGGEKGSDDAGADPAAVSRVRRGEAAEAARRLGAAGVHFLGAIDGELEVTLAGRAAVARLIRQVRPEIVIGHDPWRRWLLHPDHRAAGVLTVDGVVAARDPLYPAGALAPHRPTAIWLYGTDEPDQVVDVAGAMPAKLAALRAHASQVGEPAELERRVVGWNAAIGAEFGLAFAEAFHVIDTRGR